MNYIGIDISLNSTAIFIETNNNKYILSFTNKKDNNIYIKELARCGVKFFHISKDSSDDYSKNEIIKFRKGNDEKDLSINGKCPYFRILIKNKRILTELSNNRGIPQVR